MTDVISNEMIENPMLEEKGSESSTKEVEIQNVKTESTAEDFNGPEIVNGGKEEIDWNKYIDQFNNSYSFLNSYSWRMAEVNKNLDDALLKINYALNLVDKGVTQYPNILDTKAEVLWKLGETDKAIKIIDEAINLEPNSQYYRNQKEKFSGQIN